jgi:hypothetical protein
MVEPLKQIASGCPPQLIGGSTGRRHRQDDTVSGGEIDDAAAIGFDKSIGDKMHSVRADPQCKIVARRRSSAIVRLCSASIACERRAFGRTAQFFRLE